MRPGNLQGFDHWSFGAFDGRGRGRGRGRRRKIRRGKVGMGRPRGMAKRRRFKGKMKRELRRQGADKAAILNAKLAKLDNRPRCGWYCRWRKRWINRQLVKLGPGMPVPVPAYLPTDTAAAAEAEKIIAVQDAGAEVGIDPTAVDPGVSGYFGGWL